MNNLCDAYSPHFPTFTLLHNILFAVSTIIYDMPGTTDTIVKEKLHNLPQITPQASDPLNS